MKEFTRPVLKYTKAFIFYGSAVIFAFYLLSAWRGFNYGYPKEGTLYRADGTSKIMYRCQTSLDDFVLRYGLLRCQIYWTNVFTRTLASEDGAETTYCNVVSQVWNKEFRFIHSFKDIGPIWIDMSNGVDRPDYENYARFEERHFIEGGIEKTYWAFLREYNEAPRAVPIGETQYYVDGDSDRPEPIKRYVYTNISRIDEGDDGAQDKKCEVVELH